MEQPLGSTYFRTEKLGSGAMGSVWSGRDNGGQPYAFKVLRAEYAEDPTLVQRFVQERSALTRVDHPHVVRMHDLVVEGDTLAIVMDLVEGGDLRRVITDSGTLPPAEVCRLGGQIASGLAAVHATGLVHRDVKPENVLLDISGDRPSARVSDFGIARLADASAATRSSMMLGTPNYVAPEIAEGHAATPAADVYSLGIMLYELASGVTPFEGGGHLAVIRRHGDSQAPRPQGIPGSLWESIAAMLAKDPKDRPNVKQIEQHLDALAVSLQGEPAAERLAKPLALSVTQQQSADHAVPSHAPSVVAAPESTSSRRKAPLVIGGLLALLLVTAGGFVAAGALGGGDDASLAGTAATDEPSEQAAGPTPDESSSTSSLDAAPTADEAPTTEAPVIMPDVVGMSVSAARSELRGSDVIVVDEFDENATDNEVLAQDVPSGDPIADEVTLTVAKQPVTVYLQNLQTASGGFDAGTGQLSGEFYPNSLLGDYYEGESAEWNLGRGYRQLLATVGRSDEAEDAGEEVQVEVFLDQRKVWSERVVLGEPIEMSVDVADVLRLKIESTSLGDASSDVVLGDIRLLGLPGEVPEPPTDE